MTKKTTLYGSTWLTSALFIFSLFFTINSYSVPYLLDIKGAEIRDMVYDSKGDLYILAMASAETVAVNKKTYTVVNNFPVLIKFSAAGEVKKVTPVNWAKTDKTKKLKLEVSDSYLYLMLNSIQTAKWDYIAKFDKNLNLTSYPRNDQSDIYELKDFTLDSSENIIESWESTSTSASINSGGDYEYTKPYTEKRTGLGSYVWGKTTSLTVDKFSYPSDSVQFFPLHSSDSLNVPFNSSSVVVDDANNVFSFFGTEQLSHGEQANGTTGGVDYAGWLSPNKVRLWNANHDGFESDWWDLGAMNWHSVHGAGCSDSNSSCVAWSDKPRIKEGDDGHYNRVDGLIKLDKQGTYTFELTNVDDNARVTVDKILANSFTTTLQVNKNQDYVLDAGYHYVTIEHYDNTGNQSVSFKVTYKHPTDSALNSIVYQHNFTTESDSSGIGTWYWPTTLAESGSADIKDNGTSVKGSFTELDALLRSDQSFQPEEYATQNNGKTLIIKRDSSGNFLKALARDNEVPIDAVYANSKIYVLAKMVEPNDDASGNTAITPVITKGLKIYALNSNLDAITDIEATFEVQTGGYSGDVYAFEKDSQGNIYLMASIEPNLTFDFKKGPSSSISNITVGARSFFVAKLNESLNWQWQIQPDSFDGTLPSGNQFAGALSVHPQTNEIYVGGSFHSGELSLQTQGGSSDTIIAPANVNTGFLLAITSTGDWAERHAIEIKSDYASSLIYPGVDTYNYIRGATVNINAPDVYYTDKYNNVLYETADTTALLTDGSDARAMIRHTCTGYDIDQQLASSDSCRYSFTFNANTTVEFNWKVEYLLDIENHFIDSTLSDAVPVPNPTAGRHWVEKGQQVTLQVDGAVNNSSNVNKRELLHRVDIQPLNEQVFGLTGEYYDNVDFTGTKITRVDAGLNFNWPTGNSPDPTMGEDNFSVRWNGYIKPTEPGVYELQVSSDDGKKVWFNQVGSSGTPNIDNWSGLGTQTLTTPDLIAQSHYPVSIDYKEIGGGAHFSLKWKKPGTNHYVTIPKENLFAIDPTNYPVVALTPSDQRQQPSSFTMNKPYKVDYQWKTQYAVRVNTTNSSSDDTVLIQVYDGNNIISTESTTGTYWLDANRNIKFLIPVSDENFQLNGWDLVNSQDGATLFSGETTDPAISQITVNNESYYVYSSNALTQALSLTWQVDIVTLTTDLAIGSGFSLAEVLGNATDINETDRALIRQKLADNQRLDLAPYNGFVVTGNATNYQDMFVWSAHENKIYPLIPGKFSLEWSKTDPQSNEGVQNFRVEVTSYWPGQTYNKTTDIVSGEVNSHYKYAIDTPAIALDNSLLDTWAYIELGYTEVSSTEDLIVGGKFEFKSQYDATSGQTEKNKLTSLVFTCTDKGLTQGVAANPAIGDKSTESICVRVLSLVDDFPVTANQALIGEVLVDSEHNAPHSGYIANEQAVYNANVYAPKQLSGPIIPVNTNVLGTDEEYQLDVVWYKSEQNELTNSQDNVYIYEPVFWPFKKVRYTPIWPDASLSSASLYNRDLTSYTNSNNGKGLALTAANTGVNLPEIPANVIDNGFTIEFWVKINDHFNSFQNRIVDIATSHDDNSLLLGMSEGELSIPIFYIINSPGSYANTLVGDRALTVNQWQHFAITYEPTSTTGKMYLDGNLIGTKTNLTKPDADLLRTYSYIGNSSFHAEQNSEIDEFRIWSTVRTQDQINASKDNFTEHNSANLALYLDFEDNAITLANKVTSQAKQRIVIASHYGSEGKDKNTINYQEKFDPANIEQMSIYNQPNKLLAGYNPNEEHALLADSSLNISDSPRPKAAFALRNDLNNLNEPTSEPYVLVQYWDKSLSVPNWRMKTYKVELIDENTNHEPINIAGTPVVRSYTFDYDMTAGEPIVAPYPINKVQGVQSSELNWGHQGGSNATQNVYWEDHKGQAWAISGDSQLFSYTWYPMQPNFWWPDNKELCYDSIAPNELSAAQYEGRTLALQNSRGDTADTCHEVTVGTYLPISHVRGEGLQETQITYHTTWPDELPVLKAGETLTHSGGEAKEDGLTAKGLPGVLAFAAGQIVYDDANKLMGKTAADSAENLYSARLAQVLEKREVDYPSTDFNEVGHFDLAQGNINVDRGLYFFNELPASLQQRVYYDPLTQKLAVQGFLDGKTLGDKTLTAAPGAIYSLLPNVLTEDEATKIRALASNNKKFIDAVDKLLKTSRQTGLYASTKQGDYTVGLVKNANDVAIHAASLGAGLALMPNGALLDPDSTLPNTLYVTIAENNHVDLGDAPVALHIIKIKKGSETRTVNNIDIEDDYNFRGEIDVLYPPNVFDEKITLRHTADFGANLENIYYQWQYRPDNGLDAKAPDQYTANEATPWQPFAVPDQGLKQNKVALAGASAALLADNLFFTRYRYLTCPIVDKELPGCWSTWSTWAGAANNNPAKDVYKAQLSEGWIKRVIDRVNLFEARISDFHNNDAPATYNSMIQQAGQGYNGAVALNSDKDVIENVGLIQLYETVLERGKMLSVDHSTPTSNTQVNNALQLAATRLAQFYTLLGNEAYVDSLDPTIGFTTASGEYGSVAPSVFSFKNQMPSMIEEELALLRGRKEFGASPAFNRLLWNFTIGDGEVAYALNYNISDVDNTGFVDEVDARTLFPQGHGDAWGHYTKALRYYYDLMQNKNFKWAPRGEKVLLDGVTVDVDFQDEQRFAEIAAARAKSGKDIVELTYRASYVEEPNGQWQGYKDTDNDRSWGVTEWGQRAVSGAYFDWLMANNMLPAEDANYTDASDIRKVDRSTVPDIQEIATQAESIYAIVSQADAGQNPLGLAPDIVPFDIDPVRVDRSYHQPATHFEQVAERAEQALDNAFKVFDHANTQKNRIREVANTAEDMLKQAQDQDRDFNNRLIEVYGTPYEGTIGSGKAYAAGYKGPDLYFYQYIDVNDISNEALPTVSDSDEETLTDKITAYYNENVKILSDASNNEQGDVVENIDVQIEYPLSAADYGFTAPDNWGIRRAPGEIQQALVNLVQKSADLDLAIDDYGDLLDEVQRMSNDIAMKSEFSKHQLTIKNSFTNEIEGINDKINTMRGAANALETTRDIALTTAEHMADSLPTSIGLSNDASFGARAAFYAAYGIVNGGLAASASALNAEIDITETDKEISTMRNEITIERNELEFEVSQAIREIEFFIQDEEPYLRVAMFKAREAMRQASEKYRTVLAKGVRILDERTALNKRIAAKVQGERYKDMTFRIGQYDALQKYRAAYDIAARYVYMAARVYDYETNLAETDPASAQTMLSQIVKERMLGVQATNGAVSGNGGLSEIMSTLKVNFDVLKTQMGFNNPQTESGRFSLRHGLFRIPNDDDTQDDDKLWRNTLAQYKVDNIWDVPEYRRFMRNAAPESAGEQPGLVIPFSSTIEFGKNFFGWPLSGGDHAYDASNFATKVRSVGVWFNDYDNAALSTTPRVYLVPVGLDVMYVPNSVELDTREWDVVDQVIPVPLPTRASDLANQNWIPSADGLSGSFDKIRRHSSFRAYHDSGYLNEDDMVSDSRLVGRSVWNTKWVLVIPGGTFLADSTEGMDTFIYGEKIPGASSLRDGNGVSDIKLFFQTYSYSGN